MLRTRVRPCHKALTACAAAAALLTAGCAKTSTGAQVSGCRGDDHWSLRQQAAWLRSAVAFREPADGGRSSYRDASVEMHGAARPLCEPVVAQVEFWTLPASGAGRGTQMSSVRRHRLSFDGSGGRTVGFPARLLAPRNNACNDVLAAAYAGSALVADELPKRLPHPGAARSADVGFRTERIGASRLFPPSDPSRCDPAGPTVSPSPSPSATWDIHHP